MLQSASPIPVITEEHAVPLRSESTILSATVRVVTRGGGAKECKSNIVVLDIYKYMYIYTYINTSKSIYTHKHIIARAS